MNDLSAVEAIFFAALDKPTPGEQAAYLDQACPDPEVRRRVERLLAAHPRAAGFLEPPTADPPPVGEGAGTVIGPYKLLQQIGEGGMGVVFMAEQQEPVRRKVALKIIKPGMDSRQVLARFEAERQALALMDHANIARVLDAGATENGRPYFVMELVHGVPIHEFCDANRLTPRQRLELFVPVCQAIQHAHMKGIIHRDIKPSNVLVTMYDDRPVPKVIDFGVAKAVEQRLTERTLFTQYGALVGTFEYMSPEQAEMNAFGVDTRSDVYSLGVLLYELLTGTTPLERQRLREAAYGEIVRLIREEEPPRPSVRLSTSGELAKVAAARQTEPAKLSSLVRGELDWIVMRCLEKDRTRRYEGASALARDVQRYLAGDAVEACPPTLGYRLRKAYRKYRPQLLAGSVVGAALALGAVGLVAGYLQAQRAAAEANRHRAVAVDSRDREARLRRVAEDQQAAAARERDAAREARDETRRALYMSNLLLVREAWPTGNIERVRALLAASRPEPGERDVRGFEWHYWDNLANTELLAVPRLDTSAVAIDPGATRVAYIDPFSPWTPGARGLRVLDLTTGQPLAGFVTESTVAAPGDHLWFTPDGKGILRFRLRLRGVSPGQPRGELRRYDAATGRGGDPVTITLPAAPKSADRESGRMIGVAEKVAVSPDHSILAVHLSTSETAPEGRSQVYLFDTATGRQLDALESGFAAVGVVQFLPDGKRLALAGEPPGGGSRFGPIIVKLFDTTTWKPTATIEGGDDATILPLIRFTPDGKWMLSGASRLGKSESERVVRIWDVATGKAVTTGTPIPLPTVGGPYAVFEISPDGSQVAVVGDEAVRLYDLATGRRLAEFRGHTRTVTRAWFSGDGTRLVTFARLDALRIWDATRRDENFPEGIAPDEFQRGWTETPNGRWLVVGNEIRRADGSGQARTIRPADGVGFQLSAGDRYVVWKPHIRVLWNRKGDEPAKPPVIPTEFDFRVLDTKTGAEWVVPTDEGKPWWWTGGFAVSPDGSRLVAISGPRPHPLAEAGTDPPSRVLRVWDIATSRVVFTREGYRDFTPSLGFTADSRVSCVADGAVRLLDGNTGEELAVFRFPADSEGSRKGSSDPMTVVSPDGRWVARAAPARRFGDRGSEPPTWVRVGDLRNGEEKPRLTDITGRITQIVFSPDSSRLVTVTQTTVQMWDPATGQSVLTVPLPAPNLPRVPGGGTVFMTPATSFSPDGHKLYMVWPRQAPLDDARRIVDATPRPEPAQP